MGTIDDPRALAVEEKLVLPEVVLDLVTRWYRTSDASAALPQRDLLNLEGEITALVVRLAKERDDALTEVRRLGEERDAANALLVGWVTRTPPAPDTLNVYRAHGDAVIASYLRRIETAEAGNDRLRAEVARLEQEVTEARGHAVQQWAHRMVAEHDYEKAADEVARLTAALAEDGHAADNPWHHNADERCVLCDALTHSTEASDG